MRPAGSQTTITLTMFENAGIGEGRKITYEQLVGSLDKDGGLRSLRLLADGKVKLHNGLAVFS